MEEAMAKKAKRESSVERRSYHPLDDPLVRRQMAQVYERAGLSGLNNFPPLPWPLESDEPKTQIQRAQIAFNAVFGGKGLLPSVKVIVRELNDWLAKHGGGRKLGQRTVERLLREIRSP
jgi:hypothetical protein